MSALADDVAADDWSAAGAGICGNQGRSMAKFTWQRHICTSAAVADRGPARKNGILNLGGGGRDHDVSILITVGGGGLYCGVEPRLKVSMMFMRPPQHGHGWAAWSVRGAVSGGCGWCAVCTGATAANSSRIRAMVSVLVPLASRPQCLIRWNPLGRTCIRNRLMNSSGLSVMVL